MPARLRLKCLISHPCRTIVMLDPMAPPEAAARRLGKTLAEFDSAIVARGFPQADATTRNFDLAAIERLVRCSTPALVRRGGDAGGGSAFGAMRPWDWAPDTPPAPSGSTRRLGTTTAVCRRACSDWR